MKIQIPLFLAALSCIIFSTALAAVPNPAPTTPAAPLVIAKTKTQYDEVVNQLLEQVKKIPLNVNLNMSDEEREAVQTLTRLRSEIAIPEFLKRFNLTDRGGVVSTIGQRQLFHINYSCVPFQGALASVGPPAAQPAFDHFVSARTNAAGHIAVIVHALGYDPNIAKNWLTKKLENPQLSKDERDAVAQLMKAWEDEPRRTEEANQIQ